MYVAQIWRYPVKSMAGERLTHARVGRLGIEGDREVLIVRRRRVLTSRTHPRLLGLRGSLDAEGIARVDGHRWDSPLALARVREAVGEGAGLVRHTGEERFDVLPMLVATDGAIANQQLDARRLRPNLVLGGVEGLAERAWPGRRLRIGDVVLEFAQLRARCVMTTFDPDTLAQDLSVLRRIRRELNGTMALDTSVLHGGTIREGDRVELE